jgi:hypothetical protein
MAMDATLTSRAPRPPPPAGARNTGRGQATMSRFACPGFDPVDAANATEAANAFAEQAAVSECGLDGYVNPMSIRLLRTDGDKTTFSAFVRCQEGRGIVNGYDLFLTVEEVVEPVATRRREPR